MLLGYNTNGFAHHTLLDAIAVLSEIGYRSVAIAIDHGALSPKEDWQGQLRRLRAILVQSGMRSVIETGARFLLDPRQKHEPTLISAEAAGRAARVEFYSHAIRCAAELQSDCVSIWSGVLRQPIPHAAAMDLLAAGLSEVLDLAEAAGVPIGFEPEPGMLVDTMVRFDELLGLVDRPDLKLTLDVGHLQCQGELPIAEQIRRWAPRLVNVHLEDMRRGEHEHRMFGEGQIDFPPVLQTLAAVGYQGGIHVELSRHSHEAPSAARRAFAVIQAIMGSP
jgi:L-ribulose-5-phosphate 3-epimerase